MKKLIGGFTVAAVLGLLVLCPFTANAQQDPYAFDEISFLAEETGFGARALGMGGAYIGLADDYSAIYWNPAGLGLLVRSQFLVSMKHNSKNLEADFRSSMNDNSQSKTSLDAIGAAYVADVARGSLVYAFGYNRVHNYNSLFGYAGMSNYILSFDINDTPYDFEDLTLDESIEEDGNLSQFSIAAALEVAPNVFLGGTFNYWTGENNYTQIFQEIDANDLYYVVPGDFDRDKVEYLTFSELTGFDLMLGLTYQYSNYFRLGATLNIPRFITIKEEWSESDKIIFDDDFVDEVADDGTFEYEVRLPFKFSFGGAYSINNLILTGDVEFADWSQFRFRDDFPVGGYSKGDANLNIKRTLDATITKRFGFEYIMPQQRTVIRGGFAHVPYPVKNADNKLDRKFASFGFGFKFDELTSFDIAYRRGWWESIYTNQYYGFEVPEKHVDNKIFATFSVKF
ncbi:OmpP1/FadL family transporter [candidate division KSB1 bacterium]